MFLLYGQKNKTPTMWSDKIKVDTKVCFYFCVKINLMIVIIWQVKEINSYYHIDKYKTIQELTKNIIEDNNEYRPSYTLKYKPPS